MTRRRFLLGLAGGGGVGWGAVVAARAGAAGAVEVEAGWREALRARVVVTFVYGGHRRWVEPHALGRVSEGRRAGLGWQTDGGSESEPPPGWRTFLLEEIRELSLTDRRFAPRPDYRAGGRGLKQVDAEVE